MKLKSKDEIVMQLIKQLKKESVLESRVSNDESPDLTFDEIQRFITTGGIRALEWVLDIGEIDEQI